MEKICPVCQKTFETFIHNKRYCSQCCYIKNLKDTRKSYYLRNRDKYLKRSAELFQLHKHPCPICGKLISKGAKACKKHAGTGRSGIDHHGWKGGRTISGGYVKVMRPEHPRANSGGYVSEHIVIWEETHGKQLPPKWIIHHLNGIKIDNRPINLVALPNMKHKLVLAAKAKRIQELEAKLNGQAILC